MSDDELRCASLIAKVRDLPGRTVYLVRPGEYADDEIRVANDSLARLGSSVKIIAAAWTLA